MATEKNSQAPANLEKLDYWTFIGLAMDAISEQLDDPDPAAAELVITLNRATNQLIYDLESVVHRPQGLSWSAFRLLFVLWLTGPIRPGQAARLTGMGRAAVSQLTRTLIAKGMVKKSPAPDDARTFIIELTGEGHEYTKRAYTAQNRRESQWASSLTEVERTMLVLLLQKLMANRDQMDIRIRE